MLLPLGDDNRDRHITPVVNYILIALNILAFVFWQDMGTNIPVTFGYATVPEEILTGRDLITRSVLVENPITGQNELQPGLQATPIPVYLTLITSMFMHGGWAHLGGNMLFLWIFGDNIENALGHKRYIIFYLLCGVIASMAHVFSASFLNQSTLVASLGASGAISGVLGSYMLLYPRRGVHVWFLFGIITLPALIVVGLWFVFQVINGMGMLGGEETAGGVAYAAHIGGFLAGLILVKFFHRRVDIVREDRRTSW
ncbi:MAG TPA: rhomboid family intramembrane serine protease [Chitinophagaceae bacterium]|nr:rhomboid family intramembrane serine protease [Chitinophagaceae bacterium]